MQGFNFLLNDYCEYCPCFEPEVEKIDASMLDGTFKYINNIRCENRKKCARIAENIRKCEQK